MVTVLSTLTVLTKLTYLEIWFEKLGAIRLAPLPLLTGAVLPILTVLKFQGSNEYSENLLAQIEVPHLKLSRSRTSMNRACLTSDKSSLTHSCSGRALPLCREGADFFSKMLNPSFFQEPDYQTPSMGQICTLSPLLSSDIRSDYSFFEYGSDSFSEDLGFEDMRINSE
ncbi:hypothetical protein BGW80DRAFT_251389 [Lactifluus volemus]|nr:hypothetical protein BGW80DRAFT_251389 [Lactifluus volemus]